MMQSKEVCDQKFVLIAIDKEKGSPNALKWACDKLLDKGETVLFFHVKNNSTQSPSAGNQRETANQNQQQGGGHTKDLFVPFRCYCARKAVPCRDVVVEDTDVAKAIIDYVSNYCIENLVLGTSSRNSIVKRFKGSDLPSTVLKHAPDFCSVFVITKAGKVSSHRKSSRPAPPLSSHRKQMLMQQTAVKPPLSPVEPESPTTILDVNQGRPSVQSVQSDDSETIRSPFSRNSRGSNLRAFGEYGLSDTDISFISSGRPSSERSYQSMYDSIEPSRLSTGNNLNFDLHSLRPIETSSVSSAYYSTDNGRVSSSSVHSEGFDEEIRRLKSELRQTMDMYSNACKAAIEAKTSAQEMQRLQLMNEKKLEQAKMAEELAKDEAEKEKAKCRAAVERAEAARKLAEVESCKRKNAEVDAVRELEEKKKALTAMMKGELRYRRYTIEEIEQATEYFSASRMIGEGGYGPVYRCYLDHTPVAIKVLRPDAAQGRSQFQKEVEILSCIRHPNMVLLVGACPEYGCLVYEYCANGSLEDRLFRRGDTPVLSWQTRFRIAAEIATGLLFLHQTKPEPLVHRDLKPGNILLDRNYVSKISDVGLARLVPPNATNNNVTQYLMTSTAGTFCYIDPEYQQTGMLTTKSDVYSLGIMLLQLLTSKVAMGLTHYVHNAIENGTFVEMLDPLVTDWPVNEALGYAKMALLCAELRRKDRPDLATVVLPELDRLRFFAEESSGLAPNGGSTVPSSPAFSLVSNPPEVVSDHSGYESRSSMSSAPGRASNAESLQ